MPAHHSAKPPEDLADARAIRFFLRGDDDLIECQVSWEALDRLERDHGAGRADRLARFEQHRPRIEAAALRKLGTKGADRPVYLDAEEVMAAPAV